jgi:hypothetical protein
MLELWDADSPARSPTCTVASVRSDMVGDLRMWLSGRLPRQPTQMRRRRPHSSTTGRSPPHTRLHLSSGARAAIAVQRRRPRPAGSWAKDGTAALVACCACDLGTFGVVSPLDAAFALAGLLAAAAACGARQPFGALGQRRRCPLAAGAEPNLRLRPWLDGTAGSRPADAPDRGRAQSDVRAQSRGVAACSGSWRSRAS